MHTDDRKNSCRATRDQTQWQSSRESRWNEPLPNARCQKHTHIASVRINENWYRTTTVGLPCHIFFFNYLLLGASLCFFETFRYKIGNVGTKCITALLMTDTTSSNFPKANITNIIMKITAKESDVNDIFGDVSVNPATITRAFAIEIQWSCCNLS